MNFEDIGARVKKRRIELNLTQEKLAEKAELTETHIGAIERATSKCSIETLVKLAQILELNVDYLLFGTTDNNIDHTFSNFMKHLPKDKQTLFVELCQAIADKLK
jgi:transcriptional regulator with XRE-family HTH domain